MDIICTIGPSSWDPNEMKKMIVSGMTIARLNGAFIDIPQMEMVQKLITHCLQELNIGKEIYHVDYLLDIKGSELRFNKNATPVSLEIGDTFIIGSSNKDEYYPVTYPELYKVIKVGSPILIDKGQVELEVTDIDHDAGQIITRVIHGGLAKGGKGMNVPGTFLENSPITPIDIEQIHFAVKNNYKYIACSFIRDAQDMQIIRNKLIEVCAAEGANADNFKLVAKIEDQFGIDNIDEILDNVYGIMVARGDMAAEIGYWKVPPVQEMLVEKAKKAGKYVIVATEMAESMMENDIPSKADVTDIYTAVKQKASSLMTSAETTKGKNPAKVIEVMRKIIEHYK